MLLDAGVFNLIERGHNSIAALMAVSFRTSIFVVAAHSFAEIQRSEAPSTMGKLLSDSWGTRVVPIGPEEARIAGGLIEILGGRFMDAVLVATASTTLVNAIYTAEPDALTRLRDALPAERHRAFAITGILW